MPYLSVSQNKIIAFVLLSILFFSIILTYLTPTATAQPEGSWYAQPQTQVHPLAATSPTGLNPTQIKKAYNLPASGGTGTVAIIDAYDCPTAQNDLITFSATFGLPTPNFEKHKMASSIRVDSGWALEISLDIQWAHAIAPNAKILLVEARSNSFSDLLAAVDYARSQPDVVAISMSWGGNEFSTETSYESHFTSPYGAVFFASSGDNGAGIIWPSSSANVVAVGGTTLNLNPDGTVSSETAWAGSGGGVSAYVPEPSYQLTYGISNTGGKRAVPDVSYNGNPSSGVSVYDTTPYSGQTGWFKVGGTSAGAPQWAAIHALTLTTSNSNFYQDAKTSYASYFRDITSGSNGYTSTTGYDYVTGLGSPITSNYAPASTLPQNNGAINGAGWVAGHSGSALSFDGSGDYVNIPYSNVFGSAQGTLSFWFKLASDSLWRFTGISKGTDTTNYFETYYYSGTIAFHLFGTSTLSYATNTFTYDVSWHFFTLVSNGVGNYLYIDGILKPNAGNPKWTADLSALAYFRIGTLRYNGGDNGNFNGTIDEVQVFNRALTQAEITALFTSGHNAVRTGLVGEWLLDENTGTTTHDTSSTLPQNNGVINGAGWVAGHSGAALSFDGATNYVKTATPINSLTNFTVSAWIKTSGITNPLGVILRQVRTSDDWSTFTLWLYQNGKVLFACGTTTPSAALLTSDAAISNNVWHHIVGTYDGANLRLYVDAVSAATPVACSGTPVTSNDGMYIGKYRGADSLFCFKGAIDETQIFNRALTQAEITALFTSGHNAVRTGLVGEWLLDEGTGTTAYDTSSTL